MFECKFEITEDAKGTWDDNGAAQCFICKNWDACKGQMIHESMEDIERDLKNLLGGKNVCNR